MEILKSKAYINEVLKDLEPQLALLNGNDLNHYYTMLASLSSYKDYLARLVLEDMVTVKDTYYYKLISCLMRLLSKDDEYLLMTILTKHIFSNKKLKKHGCTNYH